jgi:hypothetical protein
METSFRRGLEADGDEVISESRTYQYNYVIKVIIIII